MNERFIVDCMLGKLAKWLRILGYDALYWSGNDWQILTQKGRDRILLTRRSKLPRGGAFQGVIAVREDDPELQLRSLLRELNLKIDPHRVFSRCLICNSQLERISKEEAQGRVPDFVFTSYSDFQACPGCSRIYWKGTHQENMWRKIEQLSSR